MQIRRERKKYRDVEPYNEAEQKAYQEKKKKKKLKKEIIQENNTPKNEKEPNVVQKFENLFFQYMDKSKDTIQKCETQNDEIEKKWTKTINKRTIKKLACKKKKNDLIKQLITKNAFIKASENIFKTNKKSNKIKTSKRNPFNTLEKKCDAEQNDSIKEKKHYTNQKKMELLQKYDQIVRSTSFSETPINFIEQIIKEKQKTPKDKKNKKEGKKKL